MARKPSQRNPLIPFYVILAVLAVGGAIYLFSQLGGGGRGVAVNAPANVTVDPAEISRVQGISIGRDDAPVVMYEFADYQCPHCSQWVSFIEPLIKERLVNTGLVRYVYYEYPLGGAFRLSWMAARAGRCANEQGKFWEYHDLVYARQQTWSPMSEGDAADFFSELSGEAGADPEQFDSCLRSDKYAREVTLTRQLGDQLGVSGTPAIFINGKRLPEVPASYSELEAVVKQEAGAAGGAAAPTQAVDTTVPPPGI
ncbi:MAG: DsbA family protein [Gemmatimonadetes bacterium]|nr:DsbA family protein [Gemmatimonadota bacterium]